jgi:hypothetical protein
MAHKAYLLAAALTAATLSVGAAQAQPYPMIDRVAQKVIAKYQNSSCAEIAASKAKPPSAMEQRAVTALRNDPQMRTYFINQVSAPIVNKLFECGLIP